MPFLSSGFSRLSLLVFCVKGKKKEFPRTPMCYFLQRKRSKDLKKKIKQGPKVKLLNFFEHFYCCGGRVGEGTKLGTLSWMPMCRVTLGKSLLSGHRIPDEGLPGLLHSTSGDLLVLFVFPKI